MPWTSQIERSLMTCLTFLALHFSLLQFCSYLVPLHPILISFLFHHYKLLTELVAQVEQIETRVKQEEVLLLIIPLPEQGWMKEEGQQEEEEQSLREPKD